MNKSYNDLSFTEKAELLRFRTNLDTIARNIVKMEKIISSGPFKKPKYKKDEVVPCLTYTLAPNLLVEFDANLGKTMPFVKIVGHYVKYTEESLRVLQANKDVLWNEKVFKHCLELLNLCMSAKHVWKKANVEWPEVEENEND